MQVDLNLLTALDALLEEQSVMGAATRLHLSQPAMSRTLGRIRAATGDLILVRVGHRMVPTAYAASIREQVRGVVRQSRSLLAPNEELDVMNLKRTFTIRCNEFITAAVCARLIARVRDLAPGVRMRFPAETSTDDNDLQQGRVDLEVNAGISATPDLRSEVLYADRIVVAVRQGHPWTEATLTTERFAEGTHVIVSRRGQLRNNIDTALDSLGYRRLVVASFPTSASALSFVRDTDGVVAVPELMCRPVAALFSLQLLTLPFAMPPIPVLTTWHLRNDKEPSHVWMRGQVREVIQTFCSDLEKSHNN